jgi:hypothetical protein
MKEDASADLELNIHRYDEQSYTVDFQFAHSDPQNQADVRLGAGDMAFAAFDLAQLAECQNTLDMQAYGQLLTASLFADERLKVAYAQARARAALLRVRLAIHPSAMELHPLRWETLADPQTGLSLASDQTVFFSRYLSSLDWRPVHLRSIHELRVLAAIADPGGLEKDGLAPIDRAGEQAVLSRGLGDTPFDVLDCASLNRITEAMTGQDYDVLYLVAHGKFNRRSSEPTLWLDDGQGQAARTPGSQLVTRLRELEHRPLLVVLVSCQSAAAGENDVLAALGPALAEAGIPAVLAMQGDISVETVTLLMPPLFAQLREDGRIDRALSIARGQVRERPDWWMPALFMRMKSGRLWNRPGFGDGGEEFGKWPAVLNNIETGRVTPILGPGLTDALTGSQRDLTQQWADEVNYPLAAHERESLPQVAQYRAVDQDWDTAEGEWMKQLRAAIRKRAAGLKGFHLPPELAGDSAPVDQLLNAVGRRLRQEDPAEPHRVLAGLPVKVYITANTDELLEEALREAGKDPHTMLCPWREFSEVTDPSMYKRSDEYEPSPEHPLVYHLFGLLRLPESLVLTEDDTFEFLIGMTRHMKNIPDQVGRALTDSALLFLGFQTEEWSFRVLLQVLLAKEGKFRQQKRTHISAQIEPEEGLLLNPGRARRYLETYFARDPDIKLTIYWGSAREFMTELTRQRQKARG